MFSITMTAARQILDAAQRSQAEGLALRVAARQIADGSLEYGFGFDEQREDDEVVTVDGLTVLIGSPSKPLLDDTLLDYVEVAPSRFDFVFLSAESAVADAAPRGGCGNGGCGSCSA